MQLDVIIPTYNRQELLQRTLRSLLDAEMPVGLRVEITVVDNNSKDRTREVVGEWSRKFDGRLHYLSERQQGRSFALNAGIRATAGDLVGMIDDDEEIDRRWYQTLYTAMQNPQTDFLGGPYQPRWGARRPDWLPMQYLGVIGWIDGGDQARPYDASYPGILMGGNAVVRRHLFKKVGLYRTTLGRTNKRLLAGEDEEMYRRLLAAGARGWYLPDLVIYHYIPPERLTKSYFRRWCFWRGVSLGALSQETGAAYAKDAESAAAAAHWGGVPRWLYGEAARGLIKRVREALPRRRNPGQGFAGELAVWDLAGFFYGRHFHKSADS